MTSQHGLTGQSKTLEHKAKISASRFVKKIDNPKLWQELYRNSLQRFKLMEEVANGKG